MSAASSSVQAAPRSVQPGVAFAAILLTAAVVLVLLAVGRPTATSPQAPAAANAPAMHDRGWATSAGQGAPATAPILHDRGASSAANEAGASSTTSGMSVPSGARRHR